MLGLLISPLSLSWEYIPPILVSKLAVFVGYVHLGNSHPQPFVSSLSWLNPNSQVVVFKDVEQWLCSFDSNIHTINKLLEPLSIQKVTMLSIFNAHICLLTSIILRPTVLWTDHSESDLEQLHLQSISDDQDLWYSRHSHLLLLPLGAGSYCSAANHHRTNLIH